MKIIDPIISLLSSYLFWDIKPEDLDMDRNKRTIIKRVLEYGLWQDWLIIEKKYGLPVITNEAMELTELDPKSRAFISVLSGVPVEKFKCYTKCQKNRTKVTNDIHSWEIIKTQADEPFK